MRRSRRESDEGSEFSVRLARPSDLRAVIRIADTSMEAPLWGEAVYAEMIDSPSDAFRLRVLLVAEHAKALVGFAAMSVLLDRSELEIVIVDPEFRRMGVARKLCKAAADLARQRGAASFELEVRDANRGARQFYLELGFVTCGKRAAYYSDPVEDAVLMRLSLTPVK